MLKRMKRWIAILFVILIACVAFFGVFKKENGIWKNQLPSYKYGMDIAGARELKYTLNMDEEEKYVYVDEQGQIKGEVWKEGSSITAEQEAEDAEEGESSENANTEEPKQEEEPIPYAKETRMIKLNPDEQLTKENFEQAKKMIQQRLKKQEINENNIRIDDVTGKLVIENTNDDEEIELIGQLVTKPGKFKVIDHQNGLVLMDNSDIKNASVVYSNDESYSTYLQIQFNEEGAEKLREISKKYVEIKEEKEETEQEESTEEEPAESEEEEEKETEKKYVSIVFDDKTMMTTYFGEEMTSGILQISVGQARTEYKEFLQDYKSAKTIADILNTKVLPVVYELESDNFVKSEITAEMQKTIKIITAVIIAIVSVMYIAKFKKNGVMASILNIGYIATLSLVLKYTNVEITMNAIIVAGIMIILNMVYLKMILEKLQTQKIIKAYLEVSKQFYLALIPVIILAVVFTLAKNYIISSIGMVVFWGITLNALYNFIFTKTALKNGED